MRGAERRACPSGGRYREDRPAFQAASVVTGVRKAKGPRGRSPGAPVVPDGYPFSTVSKSYSTSHSTKLPMLAPSSAMASSVASTALLRLPRVSHWQVRVYVFSTASQP